MSISMIGIDYNKANVDIRAMFSFTKEKCDSGHGTPEENTGDPGMRDTCPPATVWNCGRVRRLTGTEHC